MSSSSAAAWLAAALCLGVGASAQTQTQTQAQTSAGAVPALHATPSSPHLGQPLTPADAVRANSTVFPDGRGLPPGRGTAAEGLRLYESRCAGCHGALGSGGPKGGKLVGRTPLAEDASPDKTIGQYWPHATTLFDYTRRAMPLDKPGSLSDDEVYALTAWMLFANGIVREDEEMNAKSLPAVRMPNRDGFVRAAKPPPRR